MSESRILPAALLVFSCLVVYTLTTYGGIRSPDAEILFRVGHSLSEGRGFSVEPIEIYPRFGVAPSADGRLYCIYPPFMSLALVPPIMAGEALDGSGWYDGLELPLSHYVDRGLWRLLNGEPAGDPAAHALRFLVSFFNVAISAISAGLFFLMAGRLLRSTAAALVTASLFAFGTLAWPYSGTMFSEPLALLLVLASFLALLAAGNRDAPADWAISGLTLGLAAATHMTALLYAPFFFLYAGGLNPRAGKRKGIVIWAAGLAIVLAALGWYNYIRFGSLLESGRSLSGLNPVIFHGPLAPEFWRGLYGLLAGGGKGLLLFCPAVLLGALGWRAMARRRPYLALMLAGAVLFRLLFAASYYDWHGGFCLGPRYLLMALPFLVLPFGYWLDDRLERPRRAVLVPVAIGASAAAAQQLYFAIGDIFRYYHEIKLDMLARGVDVFRDDRLYLDWRLSPLYRLHGSERGAYFLQALPISNLALWAIGAILLLLIGIVAGLLLSRRGGRSG